jgi:hypothetical protein
VLEGARTQSIVAVQRRFRTKFGKDPPVRKTSSGIKNSSVRGACLFIVKRPGPSEERVKHVRKAFNIASPKSE